MIIISSMLIIIGLFFVLTSTIGILRFSDFYNKFHSAGVLDALGMPLIMIGLIVKSGFSIVSLKIFFIIIALWITSSNASYVVARSYYNRSKK